MADPFWKALRDFARASGQRDRARRERDEARAEVERLRYEKQEAYAQRDLERAENERLRTALRLIRDGQQHAPSIARVALRGVGQEVA